MNQRPPKTRKTPARVDGNRRNDRWRGTFHNNNTKDFPMNTSNQTPQQGQSGQQQNQGGQQQQGCQPQGGQDQKSGQQNQSPGQGAKQGDRKPSQPSQPQK